MAKYAPLTLSTIMPFGKFKEKGWTVQQIIDHDPNYIIWCLKEVAGFSIAQDVIDLCKQRDIELPVVTVVADAPAPELPPKQFETTDATSTKIKCPNCKCLLNVALIAPDGQPF